MERVSVIELMEYGFIYYIMLMLFLKKRLFSIDILL